MTTAIFRIDGEPRQCLQSRGHEVGPRRFGGAVLHVMSLAYYAIIAARGRAVQTSPKLTELDCLRQELALDQEEPRIMDGRMAQIPLARRPHYPPRERLAILVLKAVRGWSLTQKARRFLVTTQTISKWLQRLDEQGPDAIVQIPEPVKKFPQFVVNVIRRLCILCPTLGKHKIANCWLGRVCTWGRRL